MSQPAAVPDRRLTFEVQIGRVMADLRAATSKLIDDLPGPIRRAVDVERTLGLDRKLAWQVFRLSRAGGLSEVSNVPSLTSVARVRQAAKARGVPETTLRKLALAFERFDTFAIKQCGDRARLASMVSGLAHEQSEVLDLRVRKSLYQGNSHLWGLHAEMLARTAIYDPRGPAGATLRSILVSGSVGLQGLRRGEPLTISSWVSPKPIEEAAAASGAGGERREVRVDKPGFELLTDFCSPNLPPLMHVPGRSGMVETEMVIPAMGKAGASTLYLTQVAPTAGDARVVGVGGGMFVSVPTEAMMTELLVPAGYTAPASLRVAVYARRHHPERVFEERAIDLLPQRERAHHYGPHASLPPIAGAPRHHEAVEMVLAREGLSDWPFDVYRCRVEYPAMHSLIVMRASPPP